MIWFEKFEFEEDPYNKIDPPLIPFERIQWNRDDLSEEKKKIDYLIDDIKASYKIAILAYGPIGSGKTWVGRVIEKKITSEVKNALIVRTRIPRIQPNFSAFYRIFVDSILKNDEYISKLKEKIGTSRKDWEAQIENQDLAHCLWHIVEGSIEKRVIAKRWLIGESLTTKDLSLIDVVTKLDMDYKKLEIIKALLEKSLLAFPMTLLYIDEMENANPTFARQIGDVLRDFLDSFYEKFVLTCFFTAESIEDWYDYGYSEALYRRLNYKLKLDAIKREYAPTFLRKHHEVYRKKTAKIKDQIYPFTDEGVDKLIEMMDISKRYPGYILPNCGILARDAEKENKVIDAQFVIDHQRRLDNIAVQRQL